MLVNAMWSKAIRVELGMLECASLPVNISAVLSTCCEFTMQLDSGKDAFATCNRTNESDCATHIAWYIYRVANGNVMAGDRHTKLPRCDGHVFGVVVVVRQDRVEGVSFGVIRDGGQRVLCQGSI